MGLTTVTSNSATLISGTRWSFGFASVAALHAGTLGITVGASWTTGAAALTSTATIARARLAGPPSS